MEQNYLSDDGDMGIRQNWARGIHSKWTITWCLSIRSSNPWSAAAGLLLLLMVSHQSPLLCAS